MKNWLSVVVPPETSMRDTIRTIDTGAAQIALVVGVGGKLLGTVTDGDVRRALLRGVTLDEAVRGVMNTSPTQASPSEDRESLLTRMRSRGLHQIPLVDETGRLVGLEVLDEILRQPQRDNWVVLMAGGQGNRLRPLTDDCPKPMLKVGDRPILEHILDAFVEHGFRRFFVSVNYLAQMIQDHFGDGSRWGVTIEYLTEREPLGTAGALSLLPQRPTAPVFVMNGDLLTKINFNHLLDFHSSNESRATMCVRRYEFQIPYGVVQFDNDRLVGIEEKPKQECFVSAGIYVLEPAVLNLIQPGKYLDMPTLFSGMTGAGERTSVFPIREYWLDIGRMEDFERALGEFEREFR